MKILSHENAKGKSGVFSIMNVYWLICMLNVKLRAFPYHSTCLLDILKFSSSWIFVFNCLMFCWRTWIRFFFVFRLLVPQSNSSWRTEKIIKWIRMSTNRCIQLFQRKAAAIETNHTEKKNPGLCRTPWRLSIMDLSIGIIEKYARFNVEIIVEMNHLFESGKFFLKVAFLFHLKWLSLTFL